MSGSNNQWEAIFANGIKILVTETGLQTGGKLGGKIQRLKLANRMCNFTSFVGESVRCSCYWLQKSTVSKRGRKSDNWNGTANASGLCTFHNVLVKAYHVHKGRHGILVHLAYHLIDLYLRITYPLWNLYLLQPVLEKLQISSLNQFRSFYYVIQSYLEVGSNIVISRNICADSFFKIIFWIDNYKFIDDIRIFSHPQ